MRSRNSAPKSHVRRYVRCPQKMSASTLTPAHLNFHPSPLSSRFKPLLNPSYPRRLHCHLDEKAGLSRPFYCHFQPPEYPAAQIPITPQNAL